MSEYDYDLFTIGAGSGGVRASRVASSLGAKVGIAEEYRVGGTCVIRGCVPKKLFIYASRFSEDFEDAKGFGWSAPQSTFDWKTLMANKDTEIETLKQGLRDAREKLSASFYASVVDWEVINKGHVLRPLCSPGETWHSLCLRAGEHVVVLEQEQGAAVAKLAARVLDVLPTRYGCGAWNENVIIKKDEANRLIALIAELTDSFDPKKYVLLRRESMAATDSWKRRALRAETGIRKAFRDVRGAADTLEEHRVVP